MASTSCAMSPARVHRVYLVAARSPLRWSPEGVAVSGTPGVRVWSSFVVGWLMGLALSREALGAPSTFRY